MVYDSVVSSFNAFAASIVAKYHFPGVGSKRFPVMGLLEAINLLTRWKS